jgi:sugar phosphate isomerase/epimerase
MLTYCTNIHPGESWADVRHNLESHLLAVKEAIAPAALFPLGLRLSHRATQEIDADATRTFGDWCEAHGCYVATVNGFPYGTFHGTRVKEQVFAPDWRTPARAAYTMRVADLLTAWLPADVSGSISTVPIAFRPGFAEDDWTIVRRHLCETLEHLDRLRQRHGRRIVLALEPEPGCVLERTDDVLACFERLALPPALRDLAGICFDCCHQAVQFEEPLESLGRLQAAAIPIGKIQVSSALRACAGEFDALRAFDEPTYLHQVVARTREGALFRWSDLPAFLDSSRTDWGALAESRVHFHVPVFTERLASCGTTRFVLESLLPALAPDLLLEVETYSWDVLPPHLRTESVAASVVRELQWVRAARQTTRT